MARKPMTTLRGLAATLLVLAGCGTERTVVPPEIKAAAPRGGQAFHSRDVSFRYPSSWALAPGKAAPAIAHVVSGSAVVSVWAYRRNAVPETAGEAEVARTRLVAEVGRRDPTFRLASSRVKKVDGAWAVEVTGAGSISGRALRLASVHVYRGRGEYVIDAFAPSGRDARLARRALAGVVGSVRLRGSPPQAPIS